MDECQMVKFLRCLRINCFFSFGSYLVILLSLFLDYYVCFDRCRGNKKRKVTLLSILWCVRDLFLL